MTGTIMTAVKSLVPIVGNLACSGVIPTPPEKLKKLRASESTVRNNQGSDVVSWLCNICGYENEYTDENKTTTCLCCGEAAPANKIRKAQQELAEYHRVLERNARADRYRRNCAHLQRAMDRVMTPFMRATKALPYILAAIFLTSLAWITVTAISNHSFPAWTEQFKANMEYVFVLERAEHLKENLIEENAGKLVGEQLKLGGERVWNSIEGHYSVTVQNITKTQPMQSSVYSENIGITGRSNGVYDDVSKEHILLGLHRIEEHLRLSDGNMPPIGEKIAATRANFQENWDFFRFQAQENIQNLIAIIKRR